MGIQPLALRAYELVSLAVVVSIAVIGWEECSEPPDPNVPSITTSPATKTASVGDVVTFSVAASGPALHYQWLRNGRPIAGATHAAYTIAELGAADTGARFSVIVDNEAGKVQSAPAELRVVPREEPPPIHSPLELHPLLED